MTVVSCQWSVCLLPAVSFILTTDNWSLATGHCKCRQLSQQGDERWLGVQRRGPAQFHAALCRESLGLHVDVEQDLRVVADEANRRDHQAPHSRCRTMPNHVAEVGAGPRLPRC